MPEEEAQKKIMEFFLSFIKEARKFIVKLEKRELNATSTFIKQKVSDTFERHNMSSTQKLMKKNRNAGIHVINDLDKDVAEKLTKELHKHKQDYNITSDKATGKYTVIVAGHNKAFCDYFLSNKSKGKEKEPLASRLARAEEKAKAENARNASEKTKDRDMHREKFRGAR